MTDRLYEIHCELREMAEKEAYKLWKLKWRAIEHNCSQKLIDEIGEEANNLYRNYTAHPEWLLDYEAKNRFKYAFCCERRKHTYITIGVDSGEVIKVERR